MDKATPLAHMTPAQFRKNQYEAAKEKLQTAQVFQCTCCKEWKDRPELGGVYVWEPRPGPLFKLQQKGVPIYQLCLECKAKGPDVIYQAVTRAFIACGLFGDEPTEEGKQLLGMK